MPLPEMQALPLQQIGTPFNDDDWICEIKYDGFRALAYIEEGECRLVSRNDNQFVRFKKLAEHLPQEIDETAILDGELVCLGEDGRSLFYDLMFNRAPPIFACFRPDLPERIRPSRPAAAGAQTSAGSYPSTFFHIGHVRAAHRCSRHSPLPEDL